MDISILEIYYKNIREMKDLTIDLCDFKPVKIPKCVALIQMPNGTGKTTTMELIRYCLDGEAVNLDEKRILSFKPPGTNVKNGEFRVKFLMNDKVVWIIIKFNYENATVQYFTSSSSEIGGGENSGWNMPLEIKPLMKRNFVRLFIFDGELAGELLKSESTSAEEAINSLYHLDKLKLLEEKIDTVLTDKISGGVQTDQGKKSLQTKLNNAISTKKSLDKEISDTRERLSVLSVKVDQAQKEKEILRKEDEKLIEKYSKLSGDKERLNNNIKENSEKLLNLICFPSNLSNDIFNKLKILANQMTKLKLPKTQSMEFFEELSEGTECICGRPIEAEQRKKIKQKAKEYLTEDNIGVINSIKTSIRNLPEREKIEEQISIIIYDKRLLKENEKEFHMLDKQTKNKEKIEKLNKKITEWGIKENDDNLVLNGLTEKDKTEQESLGLNWQNNIDLCNKEIEELQEKLAKATNTVDFKNKASLLKIMLEQIIEESMVRLKENIILKTNESIGKILQSKDIKISKIGNCLQLYGRSGVSEGQKLSIAYAFLSTLFSQSPNKLPFVVDTPAAPLDLSVRREVAETIPNLFKQIVVFITSGERNGFADKFYMKQKDCLFYTIRKDKKDGVILERDLEYFKNFQSEED